MKKRTWLLLAAVGALVAGCHCDDEWAGKSRYITVDAGIEAQTRTTSVSVHSMTFEEGDRISVYAWTGSPNEVNDTLVVGGTPNTLGSGATWRPDTLMLWKDTTTPHYFLGIYPVREVTDFKADPYTLDSSDQEASDLLVATNLAGLTATDNPVSLSFNHVMAKLYVNLQFRNQWETTPEVQALTVQASGTCTIDYLARSCTATGSQTTVALPQTATELGYALSYAGIMVPQAGVTTVTVTIDGKDYTFTHTGDIPLEGNRYTTLNLIVGRDRIELGTVSINDWLTGETIDGGRAQHIE